METIKDIKAMQSRCLASRAAGQTIAFVPTMGFLHDGHLSLLREGRKHGDLLVLSIFVNPTQFGPKEDLDSYPRDFARDEALARECGVDLIFYPSAENIYPPDFATYVSVEGPLTTSLEGLSRPTHFRGVTTVVTKLLTIVLPHVALFGRKDYQQLAVIRRMTTDLNLPVTILGRPIVREADGLAMSSRNVYLSAAERQQALALVDVLRKASSAVAAGQRNAEPILAMARNRLREETDLQIDYVAICDAESLHETARINHNSIMLLAAKVGRTRLIDNALLMEQTG
ncbi:MAG: pantoate--beta-alanine ligase [Desulfuromonadales bacterium]|jgi:pantoate--beta-alanine ligase